MPENTHATIILEGHFCYHFNQEISKRRMLTRGSKHVANNSKSEQATTVYVGKHE